MKKLILALLLCSTANAKEFKFTFYFPYGTKDNKLEYSVESNTLESAYKRASSYCFDFYVKQMSNFNEEKGLDIIDSCVNPR